MHLIMQYLEAEGQHPVKTRDGGYECVSPDGEHLVVVTHDHKLFVDGEETTVEASFDDLLGEGLRDYMSLLTKPREPKAMMEAFVDTCPEQALFISFLGGVVYRETDRNGETTLLRELRDGDASPSHAALFLRVAAARNGVWLNRRRWRITVVINYDHGSAFDIHEDENEVYLREALFNALCP